MLIVWLFLIYDINLRKKNNIIRFFNQCTEKLGPLELMVKPIRPYGKDSVYQSKCDRRDHCLY